MRSFLHVFYGRPDEKICRPNISAPCDTIHTEHLKYKCPLGFWFGTS